MLTLSTDRQPQSLTRALNQALVCSCAQEGIDPFPLRGDSTPVVELVAMQICDRGHRPWGQRQVMDILGVALRTFHLALTANNVTPWQAGRALSDWARLVAENCLGLAGPKEGEAADQFVENLNAALGKSDGAVARALQRSYHLKLSDLAFRLL